MDNKIPLKIMLSLLVYILLFTIRRILIESNKYVILPTVFVRLLLSCSNWYHGGAYHGWA